MDDLTEAEVRQTLHDLISSMENAENSSQDGIHYRILDNGEPNGFENGWKLKKFHAVIKGPNNVKGAVVHFEEDEMAQFIDASVIIQHAPKEFCMFLHEKIGAKL